MSTSEHRDGVLVVGGGYAGRSPAQVAVRAGTLAGRNAARVVRDGPTANADLRQLGWVLDLGGRRGRAQIGPLVLAGPVADLVPPLMHDAIDLKDLLDIGGPAALRFATGPVSSLVRRVPIASSIARTVPRRRPCPDPMPT